MPYIKQERRDDLTEGRGYVGSDATNSGELNFLLTETCRNYIGSLGRNYNYQTLNDVVGALECCKQEFIRRVVNPFEDEKIKENGDIYI